MGWQQNEKRPAGPYIKGYREERTINPVRKKTLHMDDWKREDEDEVHLMVR